jgi:RimJ/RimL family protein N-acetyltransferase
MFALLTDPRLYEFIPAEPPASLGSLAERYRRLETRRSPDGSQRWLNWIIQTVDDDACLGFVQSTIYPQQTAGFAFLLGSAYWGCGFAHEASAEALDMLFDNYEVTVAYATTDRRNVRSVSLLKRLGFREIEADDYPHGDVLPSDCAFQMDHFNHLDGIETLSHLAGAT